MNNPHYIRVIVVPIVGPARVESIEDSLASLRERVDGRGITQFALSVEGVQDVAGVCRNDALFADPPVPTRYVRAVEHHPIPGTFLVVGVQASGDCYRDLTEDEIAQLAASEKVF